MNRFSSGRSGRPAMQAPRRRRGARLQWTLVGVALAAALLGCGTALTAPPSGFLHDDAPAGTIIDATPSTRRTAVAIDPSRVAVVAVEWRAAAGIAEAERLALAAQLQDGLRRAAAGLPAAAQGRAVVVRAAITRVEPVSPLLNAVSTLLLFVPLDRGGAAVEIEAVDSGTGEQIAMLRGGYMAPWTALKAGFSRLAPAEIALRKAAADFALLLQPG